MGKVEALRAPSANADRDRFLLADMPATELLDERIERPRSLLGDGVLTAGGFAVLYGAPGLGKTWLALGLARALVRGEPWLGLPTDPAGSRVGVVQLELPMWHMQQRLKALGIGEHPRDENLFVVARPRFAGVVDLFNDPAEIDRLRRWIAARRLDALILDALSRCHTANENDAQEMGRVLSQLDRLRHETGCAIESIHHERKVQANGTASDLDALRGTSRFQSDPTLLVRVKPAGNLRCVTFAKVSFGPEPQDIYLGASESGAPVVVPAPSAVKDANRERVRAAVVAAGRPISCAEVSELCGLGQSAARDHLVALVRSGDLLRTGENRSTRYSAPADPPAPTARNAAAGLSPSASTERRHYQPSPTAPSHAAPTDPPPPAAPIGGAAGRWVERCDGARREPVLPGLTAESIGTVNRHGCDRPVDPSTPERRLP
jgi:hypothetical protein